MESFTLVSRDDKQSQRWAKQIQTALINNGKRFDIISPDLVICVGGDGTILHAIHQWMSQTDTTAFVGIHTGTLGFFTDYQIDELDQFIEDIVNNNATFEKKRLLNVRCNGSINHASFYALNEIRVESIIQTQSIDVYFNHQYFEQFQGNGLCISGQDGSTAYNRSANGAIIWKGLDVLQMIELNGIHHKRTRSIKSPLILPDKTTIQLKSTERFPQAFLCYDHLSLPLDGVNEVDVSLSNHSAVFAHYRETSFQKRLESLY